VNAATASGHDGAVQLTRHGHSCVRLDDGDRALVIDPGMFSGVPAALDGAGAVLITHEHPDHLDADALGAALRADSRLLVWAPAAVAGQLEEFGEQVAVVAAGGSFTAAGFPVRTFGGQHAVIHLSIPVVANVGYLIDPDGSAVYHPGDSLEVPAAEVRHLLLPTSAPWAKVSEVIDFAIAVRAPQSFQIHDALVNENYTGIVEGHLHRLLGRFELQFTHLADRAPVPV
jgi:L-ascorbate metabolism protein UlaG (beta-lactamase superfamily)